MEIATVNEQASEFLALVQQGIECWVKAGQLVAREMDKDPQWGEKVCALIPGMKEETILRFDAIGRNQLSPRLMLATAPGHKCLAQLPLKLQEKYLSQPIPLVVCSEGNTDVLLVDVQNLTREQCRQVFSGRSIRTEAEQRAWIESERTKAVIEQPKRPDPDYVIRGRSLHIQRPLVLTEQDLARILSKIVGA